MKEFEFFIQPKVGSGTQGFTVIENAERYEQAEAMVKAKYGSIASVIHPYGEVFRFNNNKSLQQYAQQYYEQQDPNDSKFDQEYYRKVQKVGKFIIFMFVLIYLLSLSPFIF